ncbi:extracellular solute-binding protein [Candidimonas sp. SYP-B2681]|uniref:extracellular solute-binding protein n=1 Tax=Candidimonas sp. SYP-B2681 TaxID=2497686 RepID=UPI000F88248D|nr:extracellular solute-binding protein [Candidimonas sp. SYP-B2681]RTZ47701.1 extracellular solute-binding protein [Candidimonas sp. SYP-B2681]
MTTLFPSKLGISALFATAALTLGTQGHAAEAVVYTSNNVQVIEVALDVATKTTRSLKVQRVTSGTGALMKRIEAEAQSPLGDVVWGAGFGTMAAFKHNFQPYESPQVKGVDPRFIGPDNLWAGTNAHVMLVMVNEKQLKGEKAPSSWADLFDPKWKGKVIIGDPATSGSAYDQVYGIYKLFGQEGLDKLAANAVISKSSGQVYKSVAGGEYPLGVTMEYAAYAYVAGGQKEIRLVYPTEGVFVAPEAVAVIKNPKNGAQAAQELFDVLLSREVQEAELVETFRRPTRSDIDVARLTELPNLSDIKVFETDPLRAADEYKEIIDGWKKAVKAAGK